MPHWGSLSGNTARLTKELKTVKTENEEKTEKTSA